MKKGNCAQGEPRGCPMRGIKSHLVIPSVAMIQGQQQFHGERDHYL